MGLFGMLERRRIRREFEKIVDPTVIKLLARSSDSVEPHVEKRHFQFVVIHVDESRFEETPHLLNGIVGTICRHGATFSGIESSIVVAVLGWPFPENDFAEKRRLLVSDLLGENRNRIRIAHGECEGLAGLLGTKGRMTYEAMIPDFSAILLKLLNSEFGKAIEIP